MNEKELKEMMVSEETDLDKGGQKIDDLKAEIDRMLKKINELSPEEKVIMEKIQKVLEEHDIKYAYDEDEPKHLDLGFGIENKPFKIHIILQNGKVIFKLSFPFRVQSNAIPLVCMFMPTFNENKAFSRLDINPDDGELKMEYSYMLEDPEYFNEKYFWVYMISLIKPALEIYTKAVHLSVGMVSGKERQLYKKLLEMALETINGDFDDDNVSYGTDALKSDSHPGPSELLPFGKDDGNEENGNDFDPDNEDLTTDILQSLRRRRVSKIEEFMCVKGYAEEESEEEKTKKPSKKPENMLSMFAKKDEDNDKEPTAVGGNEDE